MLYRHIVLRLFFFFMYEHSKMKHRRTLKAFSKAMRSLRTQEAELRFTKCHFNAPVTRLPLLHRWKTQESLVQTLPSKTTEYWRCFLLYHPPCYQELDKGRFFILQFPRKIMKTTSSHNHSVKLKGFWRAKFEC